MATALVFHEILEQNSDKLAKLSFSALRQIEHPSDSLHADVVAMVDAAVLKPLLKFLQS